MALKNWSLKKKLAIAGLTFAIGWGTFSHRSEDFFPFYINKTGTSFGIPVGGDVNMDNNSVLYGGIVSVCGLNYGKINGFSVLLGGANESEINGIYLPLGLSFSKGKVNGLEAGLMNLPENDSSFEWYMNNKPDLNGLAVKLMNIHKKVNGIQVGIYNEAEGGKNLQIGIINREILSRSVNEKGFDNGKGMDTKERMGILINYNWE